ncbi:hypothetical protein I3842_10G149500 [Carya illinoinensis]|uniref:Uncharacterized protein n=1 Tax=Carya illinoinensis TaxID=32201 RepID=A0A922J5T7_CARIL|nr:hypothetical protein I3842_10G149500 [Carya illinoinensis]
MNGELMSQHIEFVADRLLGALGCGKIYNFHGPRRFIDRSLISKIGVKGKKKHYSSYGHLFLVKEAAYYD